MKRGPQVYDLPVANLLQHIGHYEPPRTRDDTEARRRRRNPAGTLIHEMQHDGVAILAETYQETRHDEESHEYFLREMGSVCLNTAWYSYANMPLDQPPQHDHDRVGRRRLELPKHAEIHDDGSVHFETREANEQKIHEGFMRSIALASQLENAHIHRAEKTAHRLRKQFGHSIGNLGLRLVATPRIGSRDTPSEIQFAVCDAGRDAIERSRTMYDGVFPTAAQLPDLNSQLSVHLRRTAPTNFHDNLIDTTARTNTLRSDRNAS